MLRFVSVLCLISFVWHNTQAQIPLLWEDQFQTASPGWSGQDEAHHFFWNPDGLEIHSDDAGAPHLISREVWLSNRADFTLELEMTLKPGGFLRAIGLAWGISLEEDRYLAFLINPEGYFSIREQSPDGETRLLPWTRHKKLREPGLPNVMTVEKSGWVLHFFLNGKEVHKLPYRKLTGQGQGVLLEGQGVISLRRWQIFHPEVEIHAAEGAWLNAHKAPLDSTVNSPDHHETAPYLTDNRQGMYFTRSSLSQGLKAGDLFRSEVQGDTMWSLAEPLGPPLNNADRNTVVGMARMGSRLYLGSHYFADGTANGQGISSVQRLPDGAWDLPKELAVAEFSQTGRWASYHMSQDQKILLLALDRPGGAGDLDLYVSFRQNNGRYTRPQNLGSTLNTFGLETSPYLSEDQQTLYFSSSGHPGHGQVDVYMSQRLNERWTRWTEPQNLGPRINGPGWDMYFFPFSERHAYMASTDSIGDDFDLYSVRIPVDMTRKALVRVHGRVLSRTTKAPLGAQVQGLDLSPDSLLRQTHSDDRKGYYSFYLPYGRAYELTASQLGFFTLPDTLDLRRIRGYQEIERDLYLQPIEVGETIRLEQVFFHRARADLLGESYAELNRLLYLMRALPNLEIEILGHTDNIGHEAELQRLSEARAKVVQQYLVRHGIDAQRCMSRGLGSRQPIADNANPATRPLNRRVEFRVLRR